MSEVAVRESSVDETCEVLEFCVLASCEADGESGGEDKGDGGESPRGCDPSRTASRERRAEGDLVRMLGREGREEVEAAISLLTTASFLPAADRRKALLLRLDSTCFALSSA
jgi:hypothetical protein